MAKLVSKLPTLANAVVQFSAPRLKTTMRYLAVEFKPPTPGELPEISNRITNLLTAAKTGKWKTLTVKEFTVNSMVAAELVMLFFIGEIIGRGSLVGYDVSRIKPVFPFW